MVAEQTIHTNLELLEPLIGTWTTEGEMTNEAGEATLKIKGIDTYQWVSGGAFILHKVNVWMGEEKTESVEIIGQADDTLKTFIMRSFDHQGNFTTMEMSSDSPTSFKLTGDKMRALLTVSDHKNMIAFWERTEDNVIWLPWMALRFSRSALLQ